MNEGSKYD